MKSRSNGSMTPSKKLAIANACNPIRCHRGNYESGGVRVYFEFQIRPKPVVFIRAIGVKSHNRVTIGGDEVDL